jgi:capsid protein
VEEQRGNIVQESTSFVSDGVEINAWGRPVDEDMAFDDDGAQGDNYEAMDVKRLKGEIKARKEAGRELDTTGVTKKSQVIALLRADDEAQANEKAAADATAEDDDNKE